MHTMSTYNENNTNILPSSNVLHVLVTSITSKSTPIRLKKKHPPVNQGFWQYNRSATESEAKSTQPDF